MYIEQLYTSCLAEAAYYIESEGEAAVIDPMREAEPYIALAKKRGASIKYVFETHFHADFVSGHLDLSKKTKAPIVYGPKASTAYDSYIAQDGETFTLGKLKIEVLHTPGHTPESTCYLLKDENGHNHSVFTGDTLFVGDVGRPDLLDGVMTKEELAGQMYDSLNTKIKPLEDKVLVYPAHGPGSACGKNIGKETFSTIGTQKKTNYALQEMSKATFIEKVTEGILPPPKYFYEDARINKEGYDSIDEILSQNKIPLSKAEFAQAIDAGATILDTRSPEEFEQGYIKGAINIGLNGQFAMWVGSLIDINTPIALITSKDKATEAILRLARVGYINVIGYLNDSINEWSSPLEKITSIAASDLPRHQNKSIIDVRKPGEFASEHLRGAIHISLADMPHQLSNLDKDQEYLVHCAGGYRSMIAASIMRKEGFKRPINVYGGYAAIKETGLGIE